MVSIDAWRSYTADAVQPSYREATNPASGMRADAGPLPHLADLPLALSTPYGQLLLIKLILFGVMLGLAALNRFQLTPALASDAHTGSPSKAIRALRLSVGLEFGLITAILALVGWFGTLEPTIGP